MIHLQRDSFRAGVRLVSVSNEHYRQYLLHVDYAGRYMYIPIDSPMLMTVTTRFCSGFSALALD